MTTATIITTTAALDFCEQLLLAHNALVRKLDDELGTLHGIALQDFLLLRLLAHSPQGRAPVTALMRPLGKQASAVTRQLLPLEKTGLVQRAADRSAALRSAGRALVHEATATAGLVCAAALRPQGAAAWGVAHPVLQSLAASPALEV